MTSSLKRETPRSEGGKFVEYFNDAREHHRENGPALTAFYTDGQIEYEEFWVDGYRHRADGPAIAAFYADGQIEYEVFYLNSRISRAEGPAIIGYYKDGQVQYERFYIEGVGLTLKEFLYETYIDKLVDPVSREQAIQLAEQAGWKITVEQLKAAVGLTLEEKPAVKLGSLSKVNGMVDKKPGV